MCGRFTYDYTWEEIYTLYRLTMPALNSNLQPNWNVCPTQTVPIVRRDKDGNRVAAMARWGLIPPWTRDLKEMKLTTINAKAETLRESKLYAQPFATRRCIVPASHWYEWKVLGPKQKQPYAMQADGQKMGFAGLWNTWTAPDGARIENFTILTTDAAPQLRDIHNRMPRVLVPDEFETWLQPDPERAAKLLTPSTATFKFWKVDPAVGNVRNNYRELVNPL
jgi:putative SOS response-associated peptidase YedK